VRILRTPVARGIAGGRTVRRRESGRISIAKEDSMKTFFLFTKLAPSDGKRMRERQSLGRAWLHEVKEKCPDVKFLSHYALLGDYDFVDIYEAPDEVGDEGLDDQHGQGGVPGQERPGDPLRPPGGTGQ